MNSSTALLMTLGLLCGHWFGNVFFTHPQFREKIAALEKRVQTLEVALRPNPESAKP